MNASKHDNEDIYIYIYKTYSYKFVLNTKIVICNGVLCILIFFSFFNDILFIYYVYFWLQVSLMVMDI